MAKKPIEIEALKHGAATRKNIPTAEFESVMRETDQDADPTPPTSGATATSIRSSSGAAKRSTTGPTLSLLPRRSIFRKRSTPRSLLMT